MQLNKGETLLPYEPYYAYINKEHIPPDEKQKKSYYFVPEEITGIFKSGEETYTSYQSADTLIQEIRALAVSHPNYVSETFLGNDSSGTYPIYQYHLKPNSLENPFISRSLPKLILLAGIHGGERSAPLSTYHLMRNICENWSTDPVLEYLRFNVELIIIHSQSLCI